ncbi:MAG: hypothetical protein P9L92_19555 [Candidatus Electryonea clarkiae]|nr:hypothetical protein [Candidatus Electryonea clarkiae]MDP8288995.1 hypothetical protein [Candidatus Electryonea clarkiae]
MKLIRLLSIVVIFSLCSGISAQEVEKVEVQGIGDTRELAIEDAKRNAVERVVGAVISSETIAQNFALLSDKILSRSVGFVRSYDVIHETTDIGGMFTVTITAEIGEVLDQVIKDRIAMELLLSWVDKPRILIAITESNMGDESSRVAESAIAEALLQVGFKVVEAADIGGASSLVSSLAKKPDDVNTHGADLILAGNAKATEGITPPVMKKAGMTSVAGVIQAKVYRADTKSVLAVHRAEDRKPDINPTAGGAKALGFAAEKLTQMLIGDVIKLWSMQQSNVVPIEIVVEKATFSMGGELLDFLRKQSIVDNVNERGLSDGVYRCEAEIRGKARDLAGILDGFSCSSGTWSVTGLTGRKIVLSPK